MINLNLADKYLYENLRNLVNTGYRDDNPRARYEDGQPAYTISSRGSVFERYDISKGELPITETRYIPWRMSIKEILVIYQLQSNKIKDFEENGVKYWNQWDIGDGTIGKRYGYTVKKNKLIDKLLINLINDPFSKRNYMELLQYDDLNSSKGLYPCAHLTQWTVSKVGEDLYLDLTLIQRSSDLLVAGSGINQIQYVALQMMVAKHCGYKVGLFEHVRKNVHIYDRHLDNFGETEKRLKELNERKEQSKIQLKLNVPDRTNFYDITIDDFELIGYNPIKPQLKFELGI